MNKELSLLNIIATGDEFSQRDFAKLIDVSLGTINNMIQSFESEKIISVNKQSPRKVYYNLTKKGRDYQNSLYVEHVSMCFDTIANVRMTFKTNLIKLVDKGINSFYIEGETDELIRLAKMIFFEISRKKTIEYFLISDVAEPVSVFESLSESVRSQTAIVGWSTKSNFDIKHLTYMNLLS